MSDNTWNHSADVEMWLDCGEYGKSKLTRISPKSVVLSDSFDAPPCEATLIVFVDGKRMEQQVWLGRGVLKSRNITFMYPLTNSVPF